MTVVLRVVDWGAAQVELADIELDDHAAWARRVGMTLIPTREGILRTMRRNVSALLKFQGRALREGPAVLAPLRLDDFELLSGYSSTIVSRYFAEGSIEYLDERFGPRELTSGTGFTVTRGVADAVETELSAVQSRCLVYALRAWMPDASDQSTVDFLARNGVQAVRKTVNKYRNEPREAALPTPRAQVLFEATLGRIRSEGDLREWIEAIVLHNRAYAEWLANGQLPQAIAERQLAEWLVELRSFDPVTHARFERLDPDAQLRAVRAMLAAGREAVLAP
jgi:hypothetical protein